MLIPPFRYSRTNVRIVVLVTLLTFQEQKLLFTHLAGLLCLLTFWEQFSCFVHRPDLSALLAFGGRLSCFVHFPFPCEEMTRCGTIGA